MPDDTLHALLIRLADTLRDLPDHPVALPARQRFLQLVAYLSEIRQIPDGSWNVGPR
jgi:hypothetical protein